MAKPIRIGVLRDVHVPDAHDFGGNAMRMVIDDFNAGGGRNGCEIELDIRTVQGHVTGTAGHVSSAVMLWRELAADEGIVGLIGPGTTPCVLAVHDFVEAIGMPAIHTSGTGDARGDWHFQFQTGYLPDEGRALAYLFARTGHRHVVCFRGQGAYGEAYMRPFTEAARAMGVKIAMEFAIAPTATDLTAEVAAAQASGADALVAMGLYASGRYLAEAVTASGWEVARYGNCGFTRVATSPEARARFAGWIAPDLLDPANPTASALFDRYEREHGVRPVTGTCTFGRDVATLIVEAIRHAPDLTRAGLRKGLESLRDLPAATGGAGSYMGFSRRDRLALKGPRLFVFKRITPEGLEYYPA